MTLKMWAVATVALATVVSGCSCYEAPVQAQLFLAFRQPLDGKVLTANDEVDAATPGYQYEVIIHVKDESGNAVQFETPPTLFVRHADQSEFDQGTEGAVEEDTVRFRVTLKGGTNVLKAVVQAKGLTERKSITVSVGQENATLEIASPAAGSTVRAADDADANAAGFQIGFSLAAPGLEGAKGTVFCENLCGVKPTAFTIGAADSTKVAVTLASGACEQVKATCFAELTTAAGQKLQSAPQTFSLDTEAPKITLAEPSSAVSGKTFQVAATVECAESGVTATLSRAGHPAMTSTVTNGAVVFPGVAVDQDGTYEYELVVGDLGGNETKLPISVVVDSDSPTLVLDIPASITADANGDPTDGVQARLTATANTEPEGTEVAVWAAVNGIVGRRLTAQTVQAGAYRVAVFDLNLAEGANTVRACVSNVAGLELCEAREVSVSTGRATCRISNIGYHQSLPPGPNPTVVNVDSAAGTVLVKVFDATGAQVGADASATASGGLAKVALSLPAADGDYALVATCPGGGVSQKLPVVVDGTAPDILTSIAGQSAADVTLGPDTADTSIQPGVQVRVSVTTQPYSQVSAAMTGCDSASSAAARADSKGLAVLGHFNVPSSGACQLSFTAIDNAGNESKLTRNVTAALDAGSVWFMTPSNRDLLGSADGLPAAGGGIVVPSVVLNVSGSGDGTLRLYRAEVEIGAQSVSATSSELTFADVTLGEGVNVLRAELSQPGGGKSCAVAVVTVNTAPPPPIALTSPSAAITFNISYDFATNEPGIQQSLAYAPPTSVPVDICVDVPVGTASAACRGNPALFALVVDAPPSTSTTYPDGKYAIRAVLADGSAESDPVNLTVDSVRPVIKGVLFQGDNGDRVMNLSELPAGQQPYALVTIEGAEEDQQVTAINKATMAALGSGQVKAGLAEFAVNLPPVGEGTFDLIFKVTDAAGNSNNVVAGKPFDPLNEEAFVTLTVDQLAPTLKVTQPAKAILGPSDDGNAGTSAFEIRLVVVTDADVNEVTMQRTAPVSEPVVNRPVQNLQASMDFAVTAGSSDTHTFSISAVDAAGNSMTVPYSVLVDLEPPVVSFAAPANLSTHTQSLVSVSVNVLGAAGRQVLLDTTVQPTGPTIKPIDTIAVSSNMETVSKAVYFPNGTQMVTATVTDEAGNTSAPASIQITVSSPGCSILVAQPSASKVLLNASNDSDASPANGLQYAVAGSTTDCFGRDVFLKKNGTQTASTVASTTDGTFSFPVTMADGEQAVFSIEMQDAFGNTNSVSRDITVDITPPGISSLTPSGNPLVFVAEANANLFPVPKSGYVKDKSPGGDAEFDLGFIATGALGGTATVRFVTGSGPTTLGTQSIDADPKSLAFTNLSLPHNSSGNLIVEVSDPAGNLVTLTRASTIDVQPPGDPAAVRTLLNARSAEVALTWTAVGDDGPLGSPSGYDLRWSTNALSPTGIDTEVLFFDPAKARQATGGLLPANSTSFALKQLPPLATYSVQLRAVDDVGNYSPLNTSHLVPNIWPRETFTNPGSLSGFGIVMKSAGDLNGDSFEDLVVTAYQTGSGAAYVYYGASTLANVTVQTLSPTDTTTQRFGWDLALGNAGDAALEARPDVLVAAPIWSSNRGRAFLFFGRSMQQVDPSGIEFRGAVTTANQFAHRVAILPDINGDGVSDVVLTEPGASAGAGRVYIFYGRTRAAWEALRVNDGGTLVILPSAADRILDGDPALLDFGKRRGFATLGDIDQDGTADFSVPASRVNVNRMYLFSGADVKNATTAIAASTAKQILSVAAGTATHDRGFGSLALGGQSLVGGAQKDLVVSHMEDAKLFIYADGSPTSWFVTPPFVISGARRFGHNFVGCDLNMDGKMDLCAGENTSATGTSAWVLYNTGQAGAEFDATVGAGFSQAQIPATTSLGISVATGDFNGDGKQDLALTDLTDSPGKLHIYY